MTEEQFKKLFKSKKSYAKLAESTTICLIETAIVHGKMTIEEFANKPLGEIKDILLETIMVTVTFSQTVFFSSTAE